MMVATLAVNVAVVKSAATETEAGTVTEELLSANVTESPAAGAVLDRVTVQEVDAPEATEEGEQASDDGIGGASRVRSAVADEPFSDAVTFAVASAVTAPTVAVNVALT